MTRNAAVLLVAGALAGCGATAISAPSSPAPAASPSSAVASSGPAPRALVGLRPAVAAAAPPLGHPTRSSGCRVRGQLPDPACTPGSVIVQATLGRICVPGYTKTVRNVPGSLKRAVYAEYGIARHRARQYEVDHLVPLELGGSNSIANLWPETAPGYGEKDRVENELHVAACARAIGLRQAQIGIARDWRHAGAPVPAPSAAPPARAPPATTTPPAGVGADFCASHPCIANFANGRGTIVQCQDGDWSHSGGLPGVCSRHGGPR